VQTPVLRSWPQGVGRKLRGRGGSGQGRLRAAPWPCPRRREGGGAATFPPSTTSLPPLAQLVLRPATIPLVGTEFSSTPRGAPRRPREFLLDPANPPNIGRKNSGQNPELRVSSDKKCGGILRLILCCVVPYIGPLNGDTAGRELGANKKGRSQVSRILCPV
jgi:hypothetical protein